MSHRYYEDDHHAQIYAQARPEYCDHLFDTIFDQCQKGNNSFRLAVDVACGTGHHSTVPLSRRFANVIGTDISEAQLEQAPRNLENVKFIQSPAENLTFLKSGTVDLVTVATALHWFDIPRFFKEVDRVLVPGGILAVYSYEWPRLKEPEAQDMLRKTTDTHERSHMINNAVDECDIQFTEDYLMPYETDRHYLTTSGYKEIEEYINYHTTAKYKTSGSCLVVMLLKRLLSFIRP